MNYCNYCGVELDNSMNVCPLCGLTVGEKRILPPEKITGQPARDKMTSDFRSLTPFEKRKLFWQISGIILISGILVTLTINFIVSKDITWSKYNMVASLALFANISFFTIWRNRPSLLILGSLVSMSGFLFLLDMLSSNIGWGTRLGIPILVSFHLLLLAVLWYLGSSRRRGFNILAIIFITISIFLVCTEAFISLYFLDRIQLGWSVISGASMIPISALMFFLHYRLKRGVELKRFFHI